MRGQGDILPVVVAVPRRMKSVMNVSILLVVVVV